MMTLYILKCLINIFQMMLQVRWNSLLSLPLLQPLQKTQFLDQHQHHCSTEQVLYHPYPQWFLQRGSQDSLLQMALLAAFLLVLLLHAPWWNHYPLWRMHLCYCLSSWWYPWPCNLIIFVVGSVFLLLSLSRVLLVVAADIHSVLLYSFVNLENYGISGFITTLAIYVFCLFNYPV